MSTSTPRPQPTPQEETPASAQPDEAGPAGEAVPTEVALIGYAQAETPAPPLPTGWESAQEQAWSEHSSTAWTLAHIIHRIYSTPLPLGLEPEQRQHFQQIVGQAAAMLEAWQRLERDQAQTLAAERAACAVPAEAALLNGDGHQAAPEQALLPSRSSGHGSNDRA